jgi:hypothetical protein
MAQEIEHLPNKHTALNSTPGTTKKKKKKRKIFTVLKKGEKT